MTTAAVMGKTEKKKKAWPLSAAILLFLITMVIGGIITISIHYYVHHNLLEQLRYKGTAQVDRFSELAAEALVTMDRLLMTKVIDTVINQEDSIVMATLVNHDGRIIVHSQSDLEGKLYHRSDGFLYLENENMQIIRCYINNVECLDFSKRIDLDKRIKDQSITLGFAHIVYSIQNVKKLIWRSAINSGVIVLAGSLMAFWLCWLILLTIDNRIKRFNQLLEQASEGTWDGQEQLSPDETSAELIEQYKHVKSNFEHTMTKRVELAKNEQRDTMAKTIQSQLIPKSSPNITGFDLALYYESGHFVGADYLDFIQLDDHHWGIVVADIAGQGVSATVAMSQVRSFLRSASQYHLSPLKTLVTINRQLYKDKEESFLITMNYGVLDQKKATMTLSRAGHVGVVVYRSSVKEFEYEKPVGIAMGIAPPETFELVLAERKIKLQPGDCILLYTDGIEKTLDKSKALYKNKEFKAIFDNNASRPAKAIIKLLENNINQHASGPMHDDRALVLIKMEETAKS